MKRRLETGRRPTFLGTKYSLCIFSKYGNNNDLSAEQIESIAHGNITKTISKGIINQIGYIIFFWQQSGIGLGLLFVIKLHVSDPSPGSIHDLTIFRNGLKSKLRTGEKLIADKGYIGESDFILTPKRNYRHEVTVVEENNTIEQIRQSIERVNHRLKIFNFMSTTYRGHGIESFRFHGECVSVICKITNLIKDPCLPNTLFIPFYLLSTSLPRLHTKPFSEFAEEKNKRAYSGKCELNIKAIHLVLILNINI
ncbi:hypothetical protein HK103_004278 [Boothiomyces macroporosus]|uniref:DDE Tnp4 domain-containing protein n=1 Tax=Boothiomyces macroporosus TaxID=261099 RepID=A0AAD5UHH8_9FUNG|nr:hypothetical protein HK103_004278 [Boothiomyces macroporosus]